MTRVDIPADEAKALIHSHHLAGRCFSSVGTTIYALPGADGRFSPDAQPLVVNSFEYGDRWSRAEPWPLSPTT